MIIKHKLLIFIVFVALTHLITSDYPNIKEFRTNPLGINKQQGFFNVTLGIPDNFKMFAYGYLKDEK